MHFQKAIQPIMDRAGGMNHPVDIPNIFFKIIGVLTITSDYTAKFKILDLMKKDDQNYWLVFEAYSLFKKDRELFDQNTDKFEESNKYN